MSQILLKEQLTKQEQNRVPDILEYMIYQHMTHEQIANKLGVSRKTIERDLNSWVNTEQFNTWSKVTWLKLFSFVTSPDPNVRNQYSPAFKALTLLIKRGGIDINLVQTNISSIKVVFGDQLTIKEDSNVQGNSES